MPHPAALEFLAQALNVSTRPVGTHLMSFAGELSVPPNILSMSKMMLVTAGELTYHLEDQTLDGKPGLMFYRPAWTTSHWHVSAGKFCTLAFVEFMTAAPEPRAVGPIVLTADEMDVEIRALLRLAELTYQPTDAMRLCADGEIKAMMGRLLTRVPSVRFDSPEEDGAQLRAERAVHNAAAWLRRNYENPEALTELPERFGLSVHHFRRVFKQVFHVSAQTFLTRVRMHMARFHLHHSGLTIKQVAAMTGYRDPLYFSRHYQQFWSYPPSKDRGANSSPYSIEMGSAVTDADNA